MRYKMEAYNVIGELVVSEEFDGDEEAVRERTKQMLGEMVGKVAIVKVYHELSNRLVFKVAGATK